MGKEAKDPPGGDGKEKNLQAVTNPAYEPVDGEGNSMAKMDIEEGAEDKNNNVVTKSDEKSGESRNLFAKIGRGVVSMRASVSGCFNENKTLLKTLFVLLIFLLWIAYFFAVCAIHYPDYTDGPIRVIVITAFLLLYLVVKAFKVLLCGRDSVKLKWNAFKLSTKTKMEQHKKLKRVFVVIFNLLVVATILLYIIIDAIVIRESPRNLISFLGIALILIFCWIVSAKPDKIRLRPILWGLILQFIFALLVLRWKTGSLFLSWCGDRVTEFLAHTDAGSSMVFGEGTKLVFFAFKLMPIIIFFNCMCGLAYYFGLIQPVIKGISSVMQLFMGTTAGESTATAANIFIGMTEAPLAIKPLLQIMTVSEIFALTTGGYASIAGSVLGAYIGMGVSADHLLAACLMSAPAALGLSKLVMPETEETKTTKEGMKAALSSPDGDSNSALEVVVFNAGQSIKLIGNILANLIAFLAIIHFVNATLTWFAVQLGMYPPDHPHLTMELMCAYIIWPIAWSMGVPAEDCLVVGNLLGTKVIANEFVAYLNLGSIKENTKAFYDIRFCNPALQYEIGNDNNIVFTDGSGNVMNTTQGPIFFQPRSLTVATYALAGFSNLGSVGIVCGVMTHLLPKEKRNVILEYGFLSMVTGNLACYLTGCVANLLLGNESWEWSDPVC